MEIKKDIFNMDPSLRDVPGSDSRRNHIKKKSIDALAIEYKENPCHETFNVLAEKLNIGLRGHIMKVVNDEDAVSDVLVETLTDIYTKISMYDPQKAKFVTWAYKIAYNNSLRYLQGNLYYDDKMSKRNEKVDMDISEVHTSLSNKESTNYSMIADDEIIDYVGEEMNVIDRTGICSRIYKLVPYTRERIISEMMDASIKGIDELPEIYRVVMKERLVHKKKIVDISREMAIPLNVIRNRIKTGRTYLANIVKETHSGLYGLFMELKQGEA